MKAIIATQPAPANDPQCLVDATVPLPADPQDHDLLVRVEAVSVNPVDCKLRACHPGAGHPPRVLGFDAAGVVQAVGPRAGGFAAGDRVYYAGDAGRAGSNAQYQLVDARLAAHMPSTLDFAHAAALPLVTLTAWELLFCRMPFQLDGSRSQGKSLLVIGGAGGVGSLAIQLARHAGFRVIATASREASMQWCRQMGAHGVIDHRQPLAAQLQPLGIDQVDVILNLADTDAYWQQMGELVAAQGHVGLIVEPRGALHIGDPWKAKSVGIHWEFMFTRARFQTADRDAQHRILCRAASLVDAGELRVPLGQQLGPITAANLRTAHALLESGRSIGKLVLAGWE